jgi:hypothetical protein
MGTNRMILRYAYHKPFMVKAPDNCEWQNRFTSNIIRGLVWFTDKFQTNKGTGAGVY